MNQDEMLNSIMAAGATLASLHQTPTVLDVQPVVVDGQVTNELIVRFDFLKSPYRITVEIEHD